MRKRLWFAPGRETAGLLRRSFSVAAIALCLGAGGAAAAECDAPDPGLVIAPPASSISPDAAAFSGVWAGTWRWNSSTTQTTHQCGRIHVSVHNNSAATVANCYGSRSDVGTGPRCDRYEAQIAGNQMTFVTTIGRNASFRLTGPGKGVVTAVSPASARTLVAEFHKE